jgi:phosphoribosylformylglycinamidine synthase
MVENIRDSQLLYIPFETSPFRLGGSLLAEIKGHNGGTPPQISDPDYFIDCYEVVRELVEDGFIAAGVTIADGGLAKAVQDICGQMGIQMNLKGIMTSYMDDDTTRILFSEIPGVIVQVDTCDMDYIDSQLLLQDVAYYPIGSPDNKFTGIRLEEGRTVTVAGILESLINQATEGED